ncbi:MAG: ATP-dependent DNA ligase [Nanobdellota archaeon]
MEYKELSEVYNEIQSTSKRLEKANIISRFLLKIPDDELDVIVVLLQGKIFRSWEEKKLGVAAKTVVKAINLATGFSLSKIESEWKNTGDLGLVSEQFVKNKEQATLFSEKLSVNKVYKNLEKLAVLEGYGTVDKKVKLIAELLSSASPVEAKYIIRTVLEDLRVGVGRGLMRDAIVWAFFGNKLGLAYDSTANKLSFSDEKRVLFQEHLDAVDYAYNLKNDFSEVIWLAKSHGYEGLLNTDVSIGKPMQSMLFQKAKDIEQAFNSVGSPAAFEYKYDGFRVQIHYNNGEVRLFTRRLENVSRQFPDVIKHINECLRAENCILDAEIVGYNPSTNQYIPFQQVSQRIKRKYDIGVLEKKFPVEVNIFDVMYYNNKLQLETPFNERRRLISEIIDPVERKVVLSRIIVTDKKEDAIKFYNEALDKGEEGVMVKNLDALYQPGSRVGTGVKLKPVMDSLDLVIVNGEWGEGKRANWLTSFTLAALDENNQLKTIGKVSTGLKELESEGVTYSYLTEILKPLIISEKGRKVRLKPKVIVEVNYEEIQKSNVYESGYALRFPRFVRLREERALEDIDNIEQIQKLYKEQRSRDKYA